MLSKLFPIVVSVLLTACNVEELAGPPPAPQVPPPSIEESLGAHTWELVQFGVSRELLEPVAAGTSYDFKLDFTSGTVSGGGECFSRWSGIFTADDDFLELDRAAEPSLRCFYSDHYKETLLTQQQFFDIAFRGASYTVEEGSLVLASAEGVLVFRPSPTQHCFAPDIGSHRAPSDRFHIKFEPDVDQEPLFAAWEKEFPDLTVLEGLNTNGTVVVNASDRTLSILQCAEAVEELWAEVPEVPIIEVELKVGSELWLLVEYGISRDQLQPVLSMRGYSFELDFIDGKVAGWDGCNRFSDGGFFADDDSLRITMGAMTAIYCGYPDEQQEIMDTQEHFFGIVFDGAAYEREGDNLILQNDEGVLVFRRIQGECVTPAPGTFIAGDSMTPEFYIRFKPGVDPEQLLAEWEEEYPDFEVLAPMDSTGTVTVNADDRTLRILQCSTEVAYMSNHAVAAEQ